MEEVTLKNVLPEKELCDLLGMNKNQVAGLRGRGLPFIKLTERSRLYFEHDLVEYFKTKRMVMNRHENEG